MQAAIVHSSEKVTLLGAAPVSDAVFRESLGLAPALVAADGAARRALDAGAIPLAVIGDMDSLDADTRARIPADRLHQITEQDSTDFDKALRHVVAPMVLAIGCTGARLDHELAVYNALLRHAARPVIVIGTHDLCFHAPPDLRLHLGVGTRVSLFPMAAVRGRSTGLRWPIDGLDFAPWGRIGTSNQTVTPDVSLRFSGPGMLVILPRANLAQAMRALERG